MRCTDWRLHGGLAGLSLLAGCTAPAPPAPVTPAPAPATSAASPASVTPAPEMPAVVDQPSAAAGPASAAVRRPAPLPPPGPVRNWDEVRLQAARRLIAANPQTTYTGASPDPLLAIPVLRIELNGDGSIRRIEALRLPRQAKDTTQLAIDALRRAAPFGDVSRLPRPWRFTETFLFDDDRRFKPRTLD